MHYKIGNGLKSVTTAGTPVPLSATHIPCTRVWVQAHEENTDVIVVGGVGVVAALAGRSGKALTATTGDWFKVDNVEDLYIDAMVSGEKVHFYYEK